MGKKPRVCNRLPSVIISSLIRSSPNPTEISVITPILKMHTPRLVEGKYHAQSYKGSTEARIPSLP